MKLLFYSLKELINNKAFCYLFVLNLSLGLSGFVALDSFKHSLDSTIKGRSKAALGADFGISARRPFTPEEVKKVESILGSQWQRSEMIEMVSMVANLDRRSRLVQIKAIDSNYPFYGEITFENSSEAFSESKSSLFNKKGLWVYPELIRQLGVEKENSLWIGEAQFNINEVVDFDAANGLSTNMAPRIYLNKKFLNETDLLKKGSIAWYSLIYKLPGRSSEELKNLRDQVFESLDSPEIRVYTHENVSQQMTTLINRLNDFLGLSSLVSLFLAGVGSAFLFRSYFRTRRKQVALLLSFGSSRRQAYLYYLFQVFVLGVLSSLLALLFSFLLVPGLGWATQKLLPFQVQFSLNPLGLMLGMAVGTFGSLFMCLPILSSLSQIQAGHLLKQGGQDGFGFNWNFIGGLLPGALFFLGLSIWLSNSYQVGLSFSGLFVLALVLLIVFAYVLFMGLGSLKTQSSLALAWALRDVSRQKLTAVVAFVAIGLGAFLLNLIPQIKATLAAELEQPENSRLPSLFMFDIQEEQLASFEEILKTQGVEIDQVSPTIRARLISVNGNEFDKGKGGDAESFSREEEREMRFRNRGFNLSFRKQLSRAERLIRGRDFSGVYNDESGQPAEISIEKRFAKRLGFKMGDVLKFEIESIPIVGKIINVREVKWTSFQPNFFVQFQPGVLEMAPKTYIATIPSLKSEKKYLVQDKLVEKLPNISIVDVSRIVKRIQEIILQMSWALSFMSILCLFAGFTVIFSIANHQARTRKWEIGLLKSLGASFSEIRNFFLWQFCLISFFSIGFGVFLSLVASYVFSFFLFESLWVFDWIVPLLSLVFGVLLTYAVTRLAVGKALMTPGRELFSSEI